MEAGRTANIKAGVVLTSATGESDCAVIDAQQEWSVFVCWGCDSKGVDRWQGGGTHAPDPTRYRTPPAHLACDLV
ncbi:MAG: hypothetical protein ABIJ00_05555 [Candidatus Eisenbacteria bacterium]